MPEQIFNQYNAQSTQNMRNRTKPDLSLDRYKIKINDIVVDVNIVMNENDATPRYNISLTNISDTTKIVLEKIRQEFISRIDTKDLENADDSSDIREKFQSEIRELINRYFPTANEQTANMLVNYIIQENLGLGKIEILLKDAFLEEIVIIQSLFGYIIRNMDG